MRLRKCEFPEFLATAVSIKLVKGVAPLPPGRLSYGPDVLKESHSFNRPANRWRKDARAKCSADPLFRVAFCYDIRWWLRWPDIVSRLLRPVRYLDSSRPDQHRGNQR